MSNLKETDAARVPWTQADSLTLVIVGLESCNGEIASSRSLEPDAVRVLGPIVGVSGGWIRVGDVNGVDGGERNGFGEDGYGSGEDGYGSGEDGSISSGACNSDTLSPASKPSEIVDIRSDETTRSTLRSAEAETGMPPMIWLINSTISSALEIEAVLFFFRTSLNNKLSFARISTGLIGVS